MKIRRILILGLCFFLFLSGCEKQNLKSLENYRFQLTFLQDETQQGKIIACGKNAPPTYDGSKILHLSLVAEHGILRFEDETHQKSYTATYEPQKEKQIYSIQSENKSGIAVLSETKTKEGKAEPTLVLKVSPYALYFTGEEK